MHRNKAFITLDDITIRLRDGSIFPNSSWRISADEQWAILGPNGSGKSTLVRSLWGAAPLRSGRIVFAFSEPALQSHPASQRDAIGYVSFELQERLMEREDFEEDLRYFAGKEDGVTTAQEVIRSGAMPNGAAATANEGTLLRIADELGIRYLLQRGIGFLSTGEFRKTLIARALMKSPKLLILDEPFDGLDEGSREALAKSVNDLMNGALRVILITHRLEEVLPNITHVLLVKDGRIFGRGPKEEILTSENMSRLYECRLRVGKEDGKYRLSHESGGLKTRRVSLHSELREAVADVLIEMKDVTVRYGDVLALDSLNWSMNLGENWLILGPNGSGKSTLVKLILGDNLQAYANSVRIFGMQKGAGETIWQIRKLIGVVSSELQVQYRKKMGAYEVMASGFYDSIGLYRTPTSEQESILEQWIELLDIRDTADKPFHQLSYGQRRMVLLVRAMVKSPALLIMDEPCHGLDIPNRRRILKIIEAIGETQTNLIYVTNHQDEILTCITHVMLLQDGKLLNQGRKDDVLLDAITA